MMFEHHHLEAERDGDCITLRQMDHAGNEYGVCLHVSQLRYVAEVAGVVAPTYPADELAKRLARQLCEIRRELAAECHHSHQIGLTWGKLHGFCQSIPESIFPWEMFEDKTEPKPQAKATGKPTALPTAKPSFELTHPAS